MKYFAIIFQVKLLNSCNKITFSSIKQKLQRKTKTTKSRIKINDQEFKITISQVGSPPYTLTSHPSHGFWNEPSLDNVG